jgi:hypothetical protein
VKPISVGDLVMVVKPAQCCGQTDALGLIRQVISIEEGLTTCKCKQNTQGTLAFLGYAEVGYNWYIPLHRLKRIPPPEELEDIKTEEKHKEPA